MFGIWSSRVLSGEVSVSILDGMVSTLQAVAFSAQSNVIVSCMVYSRNRFPHLLHEYRP